MDIRKELGKRILFLDGGMGSLLQARGLKTGELPETWNLLHPDAVQEIHRDYLAAGADIISTNTFGANGFKYDNLEEIVNAAVKNVKTAISQCGRPAYCALDIGPTGKLLEPLGELPFEDAVNAFKEVMTIGQKAGADLILIETMNDTYELKAAVLAAKEATELPVFATVVFGENGKMLTGATPEVVVGLLEGLRVDALGMNCGLGPRQMAPLFQRMAELSSTPLIITPNAGLPRTENGKTVYDIGPDEYAELMEGIISTGAYVAGGCCGTGPDHIRAMTTRCRNLVPKPLTEKEDTIVTSYSRAVFLGGKPKLIGERINPTGKKKFKEALREHNINYILEEAVKQDDSGCDLLDVNVGLPEIDEAAMMQEVVFELQSILPLPLQIDTTNISAMEAALRCYNGKAMVNSVNGKQEVMEAVFPLVAKYGGVVVGLALDEGGIPDTAEGRLAIADKIYAKAAEYKIPAKDIVIDALCMTMSTDDHSALTTLETVRRLSQQGRRTVLGVSNISFGLPHRSKINSTFFTMAMEAGLSAGIINPNMEAMRTAYDSFCVLGGYDPQCLAYVEKYAALPETVSLPKNSPLLAAGSGAGEKAPAAASETPGQDPAIISSNRAAELTLTDCIIKGLKDKAYESTKEALKTTEAMEIINRQLVPALDQVGKGFEKGTMFLPQLLMSAEAANAGFEAIKEYLKENGGEQEEKGTIVIATVKGDIHDIGKNIVKVLLENYGYHVIDLGKDVPPETVVETVVDMKAPLVGLSALMTTTVVNMEETIRQLHEACPWCKIMVGGAVLTQEYADQIGADFYGKDAMQSVHYAEDLFSSKK